MARRTYQHISEVEGEPVIGRRYLVPCVKRMDVRGRWPILGPLHEDADLKVPDEHWHYDFRFISAARFEREWGYRLITEAYAMGSVIVVRGTDHRIVNQVLRCQRRAMDFPCLTASGAHPIAWFPEFEARYAEVRLKCRTCPHRGMPLEGQPADEFGRVVCPGHGLRWNLNTGELVPRLPEVAR